MRLQHAPEFFMFRITGTLWRVIVRESFAYVQADVHLFGMVPIYKQRASIPKSFGRPAL